MYRTQCTNASIHCVYDAHVHQYEHATNLFKVIWRISICCVYIRSFECKSTRGYQQILLCCIFGAKSRPAEIIFQDFGLLEVNPVAKRESAPSRRVKNIQADPPPHKLSMERYVGVDAWERMAVSADLSHGRQTLLTSKSRPAAQNTTRGNVF